MAAVLPHHALVRYLARQPGWSVVDHARTVAVENGGTRLRAGTTITPSSGLRGVRDRLELRVAQRLMDDAMARLPAAVTGPRRT